MDSIKTFEHFEYLLNEHLVKFEWFIIKDINDCKLINNSKNDIEYYYTSKRKKVLNKINTNTLITRFDIFDNKINVNSEDINVIKDFVINRFEQIDNTKNWIDGIKKNTSPEDLKPLNKELTKRITDLDKYCNNRLKDFKTSFKLAYYNHRLNKYKPQQQLTPVNEDFKNQYLNIFTQNGFELFKFIDANYIDDNKTIKYAEIKFFLKQKNYVKCSDTKFLLFLKTDYNLIISKLDNSKIYSDEVKNRLTLLMDKFHKLYNIEKY